jgi:general secretion pathway protein G
MNTDKNIGAKRHSVLRHPSSVLGRGAALSPISDPCPLPCSAGVPPAIVPQSGRRDARPTSPLKGEATSKGSVLVRRAAPAPRSSISDLLSSKRRAAAFTLIELLVVITVIGILAGITIAAMGGVNEKAARDRTSGDIAAISTALEVYRSRFDAYPPPTNTDRLPFLAIAPFFETRTSQTNANLLIDVYGQEFRYRNPGQRNPATFDLWSVGKNRSTNDHIGNW